MFAQTISFLKEPHVYKAITPFGSFVCKRTQTQPKRLQFIGGVLRHLQQRGWDGAIPILYTKYDDPYVQRGSAFYYLTPWQPGIDYTALATGEWAPPLVARLAELHQLTQNYRFEDPRQVEALIDSLLKRWECWLEEMEQHAATARARPYPSPFDVVFLANQAFIADTAGTAIRLLREWRERHQTYAHFRLVLIHGYPHPAHAILERSGQLRLINFDRALFDTPVRDLTLFFRMYFQRSGDAAAASELLQRYTGMFPLRPEEQELLTAFLCYPERVMRDLEAYYCGKRKWTELYAVKRLEKDIDRLMHLCRWLHHTF